MKHYKSDIQNLGALAPLVDVRTGALPTPGARSFGGVPIRLARMTFNKVHWV
jgi:hypothetical protein